MKNHGPSPCFSFRTVKKPRALLKFTNMRPPNAISNPSNQPFGVMQSQIGGYQIYIHLLIVANHKPFTRFYLSDEYQKPYLSEGFLALDFHRYFFPPGKANPAFGFVRKQDITKSISFGHNLNHLNYKNCHTLGELGGQSSICTMAISQIRFLKWRFLSLGKSTTLWLCQNSY